MGKGPGGFMVTEKMGKKDEKVVSWFSVLSEIPAWHGSNQISSEWSLKLEPCFTWARGGFLPAQAIKIIQLFNLI